MSIKAALLRRVEAEKISQCHMMQSDDLIPQNADSKSTRQFNYLIYCGKYFGWKMQTAKVSWDKLK